MAILTFINRHWQKYTIIHKSCFNFNIIYFQQFFMQQSVRSMECIPKNSAPSTILPHRYSIFAVAPPPPFDTSENRRRNHFAGKGWPSEVDGSFTDYRPRSGDMGQSPRCSSGGLCNAIVTFELLETLPK